MRASFLLVAALLPAAGSFADSLDPRTNAWFTTYSGQYACICTNDTMLTNGTTLTTWSNGSQTQSQPAYCGLTLS